MSDKEYTTDPSGTYIVDPQGYVVSGNKTPTYGESFLAGQQQQNGNKVSGSTQWNDAWTQGYNNSTSGNNPFSGKVIDGYDLGAGYSQGQLQYKADKTPKTDNNNNNDKLTKVLTSNNSPTTTTDFNTIFAKKYIGWDKTAAYNDWKSKGSPAMSTGGGIDDLAGQQEAAARAAAEAARLAAQKKYDAAVRQAGVAKEGAKDQYDWLIDTLGSNKEDSLTAITKNESTGLADYEEQKTKTADQYAKAKQEILSTYRDLNAQQEKIMRGTGGMANSSRSQEAQLKLNNLLGKDLSTVTTNEADSIGAIGKAIVALKDKTIEAKNSVEKSTKEQTDKATLDYNAQIKAIDEDVNLAADAKEVEYYNAEVNLQNNIVKINTWAAETKVAQENQQKLLQAQLDALILNLTDSKTGLNTTLADKIAKTNTYISSIGYNTKLDAESVLSDTSVGQKQTTTYKSKSELDKALANGEITQGQYNNYLASMGGTTDTTAIASILPTVNTTTTGTKLNSAQTGVNNDSLLRSILGNYA